MKQGLFLIFAFCAISNAYAQMDCESIPSCAELGYTQASCPEGSASLKCPFDETKFYCIGGKKLSDAPAPVITPEDWTAECADTIAHCITLDSSCRCTACESGYLVTNGNCVSECDKSVAICAAENKIFKADTCTCESCPTNYLPVDGICKKMCTVVANCTDYDSAYDPCNCTTCKDGFTLCSKKCYNNMTCADKCQVYAGQANTKALVSKLGNKALAAYAASQFYVGDKNGDFGQGKWYLPSIGEWMEFYGTDTSKMTDGRGTSGTMGYISANMTLINNALVKLASEGVDAAATKESLWSSSQLGGSYLWRLISTPGRGDRSDVLWNFAGNVRCALLLKNIFNPSSSGTAPQIGDVMYLDKTYGSAEDYDGSKEVAGIIAALSEDKRDVKIINLKRLTFSSKNTAGNFNPDDPYGGSVNSTNWSSTYYYPITEIQSFDSCQLLIAVKVSGCSCPF